MGINKRLFGLLAMSIFVTMATPVFSLGKNVQVICKKAIKVPDSFREAEAVFKKNPDLFQLFIQTTIVNGFILGPKMLSIFEEQLIHDGTLNYDSTSNSFTTTKEQAKANQDQLEKLMTAPEERLNQLSQEMLKDMIHLLALDEAPGSPEASLKIQEENAFKVREWDTREIAFSDLLSNQVVLSRLIKDKAGKALLQNLIKDMVPVYTLMLSKLLFYTNSKVDWSSIIAGRTLVSVTLSSVVGFLDIHSLAELTAAGIGALADSPSAGKVRRQLRMKKVIEIQNLISKGIANHLLRNLSRPQG